MQNKLPGDPASLILGIIGLVLGITACCCYWIAIIPLALSIWGLIMANKSMKLYRLNPTEYTASSKSNVSIGRVINIISIVFNGIFFVIILFMFLFLGAGGVEAFFDEYTNDVYGNNNTFSYEDDYGTEEEFDFEEVDSISTDSIFLQEVYPEGDSD